MLISTTANVSKRNTGYGSATLPVRANLNGSSFVNIFRLNTQPNDTSLGGYFTQSQQGSPIRRVFENNMDEFSFNSMDESILKTINSSHQAYFDLISTIKGNAKFGCKV